MTAGDLDDDLGALRAELELLHNVGKLSELLGRDGSLDSVLRQLVALTVEAFPGTEAGISLIERNGWRSAAPSSGRVDEVERREYEFDQGPCVDAGRTGVIFESPDLAVEGRWPQFTEMATTAGFRSTVAVPMVADDETLGALNVYAETPDRFADHHRATGVIAAQGAIVIRAARMHETNARLVDQLREALASRAVIERAKGVLIARERCGEDEAFDILRRASQRENRKLREIAEEIVARAQDPAPLA